MQRENWNLVPSRQPVTRLLLKIIIMRTHEMVCALPVEPRPNRAGRSKHGCYIQKKEMLAELQAMKCKERTRSKPCSTCVEGYASPGAVEF